MGIPLASFAKDLVKRIRENPVVETVDWAFSSADKTRLIEDLDLLALAEKLKKHAQIDAKILGQFLADVSTDPIKLQMTKRRLDLALNYLGSDLTEMFAWLFKSREISNFTYDITDINKR